MDPDDTQNKSKLGGTVGVGQTKPTGMMEGTSGVTPPNEDMNPVPAEPTQSPSLGVSGMAGGSTEPPVSVPESVVSAPPAPPEEVGETPLSGNMPVPTVTQVGVGGGTTSTEDSENVGTPNTGLNPMGSSPLTSEEDEGGTGGGTTGTLGR